MYYTSSFMKSPYGFYPLCTLHCSFFVGLVMRVLYGLERVPLLVVIHCI